MAAKGSRIEHFPFPVSARIAAAVDLLAPGDGERLLEIGCGTGQATALICARTSARVVAIDRSDTAVARARIRGRAFKTGAGYPGAVVNAAWNGRGLILAASLGLAGCATQTVSLGEGPRAVCRRTLLVV